MIDIKLDENAYCLSCNLDRYNYLVKCFDCVGLKAPILFPGIRHPSSGAIGCSMGHIALIMMARCRHLPYIVIYEDDAYPRPDVKDVFESIKQELSDISWQVLVLGRNGEFSGYNGPTEQFWSRYPNDIARNSLVSKVKLVTESTIDIPLNPNGSHAYIIKQVAYNEWLDILMKQSYVDIALGSNHWMKNIILWTKELLFVQKQIDNKCMTRINPQLKVSYIYPYHYDIDYSGCCSIFRKPPKGFVDELFVENNLS